MKLPSSAQTSEVAAPSGQKRSPARDTSSAKPSLSDLSHDLSNALETVLQANYLLVQADLSPEARRWAEMAQSAAQNAAQLNRELRTLLREKTASSASRKKSGQPPALELVSKPTPAEAGRHKTATTPKARRTHKRKSSEKI